MDLVRSARHDVKLPLFTTTVRFLFFHRRSEQHVPSLPGIENKLKTSSSPPPPMLSVLFIFCRFCFDLCVLFFVFLRGDIYPNQALSSKRL